MAIYTILTETELENHADKVDFILNNFVDTAKNPKRVMLKFDDSLPASLSSYDSYTESQVQTMQSDTSSDWYLQ
tara:strand:+ start:1166 stop:1387 length:222 start_codon:yes stop_codon:yes gene_type:complete